MKSENTSDSNSAKRHKSVLRKLTERLASGVALAAAFFVTTPASAQLASIEALLPDAGIAGNGLVFVFFVGAFSFAMWSATWLIRERRALDDSHRMLSLELADLKARHERAEALLDAPDQRVVVWDGEENPPTCRGALVSTSGTPSESADFVAFGTWMAPNSAQSFDHAIQRLRSSAEAFEMPIETRNGNILEAQGRAFGSHAFVRFLSLTGDRAALALLESQYTSLMATTDTMRTLLEAVPMPVWLRDREEGLTWANPAYVKSIDTADLAQAVASNQHLLDAGDRNRVSEQLHGAHDADGNAAARTTFQKRLHATMAGDRRTVDVTVIEHDGGQAGLAVDMSEVEQVQSDLRRTLQGHAQTLDQLATAVAIFDAGQKLAFHNQALADLWALAPGFLDSAPSNAAFFNELRDSDRIANQPDWAKWRGELLAVHHATEPAEHFWHLPDGRSLRVIANPHRQGGVTWVFENITEQLEMESRYIAMTQVQGETLDHLGEAIAVFASDGRLKLSNPALQELWHLEDEQVAADTPIAEVARYCGEKLAEDGTVDEPGQAESAMVWDELVTGVTGVTDSRDTIDGRLHLMEDRVLDYALVPLPNGQTLLSFADVSDSVSLEQTLLERNEALEAAQRLKNEFLEHVSYEFRAPLTNIKGFAEILQGGAFGPLNEKQAEYIDHIASSSGVLHTLVDNLLDLATMDAGALELDLEQLDLADTLEAARSAVMPALKDRGLALEINVEDDTRFVGDSDQIQKILGNLLQNASRFSPKGGTIRLDGVTSGDDVVIRIADEGPGIPAEIRDTIFERFSSSAVRSHKRGAGLGLAVAKALCGLHGGALELDSAVEEGATFICRLPIRHDAEASQPMLSAAE
ncbi:PAS domain-containing sensor histidine kinase [Ahrensia sp. R2A130]|uniref:sensor histidine kinase n=1 Tax=Ahrensia sp. R2A130 TaxID=744979 RepID=UPI0001E0E890|nr:PAS domain-containing sensor histidine kinase [Ahrensia sp. R2A130]EFL89872.1 histidine kinase [Ahrensia sp. R2A130]